MQVVEFFQREVEQLEEKLAELGGRVREGRAGARSVEVVRKEGRTPPLDIVSLGSPEKDTTVKKAFEHRFCKYSSHT